MTEHLPLLIPYAAFLIVLGYLASRGKGFNWYLIADRKVGPLGLGCSIAANFFDGLILVTYVTGQLKTSQPGKQPVKHLRERRFLFQQPRHLCFRNIQFPGVMQQEQQISRRLLLAVFGVAVDLWQNLNRPGWHLHHAHERSRARIHPPAT